MNYDRLLTRVFDKQKKKMLYPNTEENSFIDCVEYTKLVNNVFTDIHRFSGYFLGVNNEGFFAIDDEEEIHHIKFDCDPLFKDRFVPMMCWGAKDIDNKMAYEADIVRYRMYHNGFLYGVIESDTDYNKLWVRPLGTDNFPDMYVKVSEIIGNRWENPELNEKLLKVKQ